MMLINRCVPVRENRCLNLANRLIKLLAYILATEFTYKKDK